MCTRTYANTGTHMHTHVLSSRPGMQSTQGALTGSAYPQNWATFSTCQFQSTSVPLKQGDVKPVPESLVLVLRTYWENPLVLVSAGGLRQSPTRWRRQDWGAGGSPPVSCLSLQKIYPQVRQLETPLASRLEVSVAQERGAAELCGPGWGWSLRRYCQVWAKDSPGAPPTAAGRRRGSPASWAPGLPGSLTTWCLLAGGG